MRLAHLALPAAAVALAGGFAAYALAETPLETTPPPVPSEPVVCETWTVDSSFGAVSKTALDHHRVEVEDWLTERAREGYVVPLHEAVFPPADGRTFGSLICVGRR